MGTSHPASSSTRSAESLLELQELFETDEIEEQGQPSARMGETRLEDGSVPNSIADDLADTTRSFLQHGLITIILALRLCILPLTCVVQALAGPKNRRTLRDTSLQGTTAEAHKSSTNLATTTTAFYPSLSYVANVATLPFRMTRDLYRICSLLQQYPDILPAIASQLSLTPEGRKRDPEVRKDWLPGVSAHVLASPPAPHEAAYGAPSERENFDEDLTSFDMDESRRERPGIVKDDQVASETTGHEKLRSLQNTPPELHRSVDRLASYSAVRERQSYPRMFACADSVLQRERDSPAPPSTDLADKSLICSARDWDQVPGSGDRMETSLSGDCMGADVKELPDSTDIRGRCSTYLRRHRPTLLPMRLGTRSAIDLGTDANYGSKESLSLRDSPPSGGKLRKKRPEQVVTNKSSRTTLVRRF